jgi:enoyl-CoA hydratase/carnithine racemase
MTEHVIVNDEAGIRTIRMNRPEKKNALTLAMYDAMTDALETASANDTVRCVVFAGVPGAFSAGNDLADFLAATQGTGRWSAQALRFLPALVHCRKPLVAAVSGVAVGIGTTMLLHCDYVAVATDARLSTPFVGLGLVPEAASSLLAPRMMGPRRAFELLVMGHVLNALQAKECGIANVVVAPEDVDAMGLKAAREIATLPTGAVAAARALMRGSGDELEARIALEGKIFNERLQSPEAKTALEAFFARKR